MIKYFITPNVLTMFINGKQIFVPSSHLNYGTMCKVLKGGCQDEKEIMTLNDLKNCMLTEFPDFVEVAEDGKLVLKHCHEVNVEKFTKEALQSQRDGKDTQGFFCLLMNMSENKTIGVADFLQWLKSGSCRYTINGTILSYGFIDDGGVCFLQEAADKNTNAIVDIKPQLLEMYVNEDNKWTCVHKIKDGSFTVMWQGENKNLPNIDSFNVFSGDGLLDCF